MIVNLSPVDYNFDETQNSLQYASRVKLITNDVQKNVETKDYARLKEKYKEALEKIEQLEKTLQKNDAAIQEFKKPQLVSPSPNKYIKQKANSPS